MKLEKKLYGTFQNPFLIQPHRPVPDEVAVIGAGTIGPDIGYYLRTSMTDKTLYLVDVVEEPLKKAENRYQNYVKKSIARGMRQEMGDAVLKNVVYTTDYERIKNCGLVIEAATENLELKKKIFSTVENIVSEDAFITSNTSSLPAERLFSEMKRPERTTVTHFFAPAWRSLPVEVINWEGAAIETVEYLFWFLAQTGKVPIMTDSVISFMLNRIFENWVNEAVYLLDHATASQIDSVVEEFVGAGPFFVANMSNGNPLVHEANILKMEEGECYKPADLLVSVGSWVTSRPGTKVEIPDEIRQTIRDRMLGIVFSQCFDITDRQIGTQTDLNLGAQIGLGFKKGPFDIMNEVGEGEVKRIQARFSTDRSGFPKALAPIACYQDFNRHLLVDKKDGVQIITIRRPQAMNALNGEITKEILAELKRGATDPSVKGFVLTGYGTQAFSAGADIKNFKDTLGDKEAGARLARDESKVLCFIDQMEKPVVAAVNGMALGGGLEVAIRCHAMVATPNAMFQFPEITLGILPGMGGCVIPYRKWPHSANLFHDMILQGKKINANEAMEMGLVKEIAVDYPAMIDAAIAEVKRLQGSVPKIADGAVTISNISIPEQPMAGKTPLSKEAVEITAKVIRDAAAADCLDAALEVNYQGAGELACLEASREGITAFLEKRLPEFKQ